MNTLMIKKVAQKMANPVKILQRKSDNISHSSIWDLNYLTFLAKNENTPRTKASSEDIQNTINVLTEAKEHGAANTW